ncbi:protease inhibitor Epi10, partial [Phytophthora megakarya]
SVGDPTDCPDPAVDDPVTDENGVGYTNKCYKRMAKCQTVVVISTGS